MRSQRSLTAAAAAAALLSNVATAQVNILTYPPCTTVYGILESCEQRAPKVTDLSADFAFYSTCICEPQGAEFDSDAAACVNYYYSMLKTKPAGTYPPFCAGGATAFPSFPGGPIGGGGPGQVTQTGLTPASATAATGSSPSTTGSAATATGVTMDTSSSSSSGPAATTAMTAGSGSGSGSPTSGAQVASTSGSNSGARQLDTPWQGSAWMTLFGQVVAAFALL